MAKQISAAWAEINPAMALALRPEPHWPSLVPASPQQFRDELFACIRLVAPVGMTEDAQREWLAVAWKTLEHLPADLLAIGCKVARQTCDHPAKIVPAIVAETKEMMEGRRRNRPASVYRALPAPTPVEETPPLTLDQWQAMPGGLARALIALGRKNGFIEPDVLAAYDARRDEAA